MLTFHLDLSRLFCIHKIDCPRPDVQDALCLNIWIHSLLRKRNLN